VFDKWVPATNDLGIASVNVAATTLKMPVHEASVTATFKKASPSNTSGSGSVSGNNSNNSNRNKGGNTIIISKSGISNTDLASAQVTGSNDNYVIRISETAAATAAVEKALTNEYGSLDGIRYSAMDISLYDATGTNRITNYSGLSVTLTLPIPDVLTQYAGNNKVAGVVNEKLDKLSPKFTTIDGVPCITFTCTHFSPYTIYVDTGNLTANGVSDISPKTGDIQPKWFLVAGLAALSIALFFVKDKRTVTGRIA
ncbi:MAG: LPXTG cell wall anchor domain-containing protein, partial [Lachnospiraceae bacterium]|nr:LPXTG cell wall anchor domain-containing protein [Lachnospiraceae bacterium]